MLKRTARPFYNKTAARKDRDAAVASRFGLHALAATLHHEADDTMAKRQVLHTRRMAAAGKDSNGRPLMGLRLAAAYVYASR